MMLILGITFFVTVLAPAFLAVFLFNRRKRHRRSPLTEQLLRGPGETLRNEIERTTDKVLDQFFALLVLGFLPVLFLTLVAALNENHLESWHLIAALFLLLTVAGYGTKRFYALLIHRQNLVLGLDAELAVGQELNHLMAHGCRVYHDVPAEKFNIDHVVIAPQGIYSIETKGRAKPSKRGGSAAVQVSFDGEKLNFPEKWEREPVEQARKQAAWLAKWLSSAIGEKVSVKPALALPGWYVTTTQRSDLHFYNGKRPEQLLRGQEKVLDEKMFKRIVHQLEQRCRDVAPGAYRKGQ